MPSILVIDDEGEMRTVLQSTLNEAGYQVTTVANGAEAMRTLAGTKIDLLITDVIMPGKDGVEILLDLRKSRPGLPAIVMTGGGKLSADYYLKIARSLGAKGMLQKPFSREQLLQTVALALPPSQA